MPADAADTPSPAPADAAAAIDADRSSGRTAADLSARSSMLAAGAANTGNGATGAKSDSSVLPNLGFAGLAATTPSSTAGTTSANGAPNAAAAVPLAGLGVAIAARAQSGSNQFDIRLDPPELGRIDVRLDVDSTGQVMTHLTADRADTLQLLQSQQPQIEQALQQAGLKTADDGLQFSLRDQSFAGGQNNNGAGSQGNNPAQVVIPDADLPAGSVAQAYTRAGLGSGVDIRV
jgi:chemotaxis protein MotD